MKGEELQRVAGSFTGTDWRYNADLAWLHAEDSSGEIYTIANLALDSRSDGRCYGASRNGPAIAAAVNHLQTLAALVEAVEFLHSAEDAHSIALRAMQLSTNVDAYAKAAGDAVTTRATLDGARWVVRVALDAVHGVKASP